MHFSFARRYLGRFSTRSSVYSTAGSPSTSKLSNEDIDIWEHAALLYHGFEWQNAVDAFRYLMSKLDGAPRTLCAINTGLVQSRLGDYLDARQTLEAAERYDQAHALTPYLLALVEWVLGDVVKARACLEGCYESLRRTGSVDHSAHGMDFNLTADHVYELMKHLRKTGYDRYGTAKRGVVHVLPSVLSADCIFEAPRRREEDPHTDSGHDYGLAPDEPHDSKIHDAEHTYRVPPHPPRGSPQAVEQRPSSPPKILNRMPSSSILSSTRGSSTSSVPHSLQVSQPGASPPVRYLWLTRDGRLAGIEPIPVVQTSLERVLPVRGGPPTVAFEGLDHDDLRSAGLPPLHQQKSSVSSGSGPRSHMSPKTSTDSTRQTISRKFERLAKETWIDRAARRLAEPKPKSKRFTEPSSNAAAEGDDRLRSKRSMKALFRPRRRFTSLATVAEDALPARQKPVPRNPRGEYSDITELAHFIREHDDQAPLDLLIWPRGPRTVPPSKELAAFLKSAARDRLCVDNTGAFSYNIAREDLLIGAPMPWANQATREMMLAGKRHSAPKGLRNLPSDPSRMTLQPSHDAYATPRAQTYLAPASQHPYHRAYEEVEAILELLLPTVYNPHNPYNRLPTPSLPPQRHSLDLLNDESSVGGKNIWSDIHTAASSSSNLFAGSIISVERADRARDAALRMLEGRRRATLVCRAPSSNEAEILTSEQPRGWMDEPLPPGQEAGEGSHRWWGESRPGSTRWQRIESMAGVMEDSGLMVPPFRIPSREIFGFGRRGGRRR